MNTVTAIGSINMDITLRLTSMPKSGETMHTHKTLHVGEDKGTSQVVAAKRSGARISFTEGVGADSEGQQLLGLLTRENADISGIVEVQGAMTEQIMIMTDTAEKNSTLVRVGANNTFHEQGVLENKQLTTNGDPIIAQPESSLDATILALSIAKNAGETAILSPAPARETAPTELFEKTGIIILNGTETEVTIGIRVTDHNSSVVVAEEPHELGIGTVIITLGSAGVLYHTEKEHGIVPAFKVGAADITAVDGALIGALSSISQPGLSSLKEVVLYGNLASPVAVQSYSAQLSIPYRGALEQSAA